MNSKFFDLKKEKQDRMINAALKIFAIRGYRHASTDDIVREAAVSKGLLFHYFESKLGVYTFIYDYSVRYMILELRSTVDPGEKDLFEVMKQIELARVHAAGAVYGQIDYSRLAPGIDGEKLRKMLDFTVKGLMTERFQDASFQPDMLYEEICGYLDMMKKIVYRPI